MNEKLFIGWVGPRGIVAAGIASLFGSKLVEKGVEGAELITPLVFMVVLGTVLLNATTARMVARWLGVFLDRSEGILIVGASKISRLIAAYLKENQKHVVLVDNNPSNIAQANKIGIEALVANIYSDNLTNNIELNDIGYLFAMTGNSEINKYALKKFGSQFGENGSFRVLNKEELQTDAEVQNGTILSNADFTKLSEIALAHPTIQEIAVNSEDQLNDFLGRIEKDKDRTALFVKSPENDFTLITALKSEPVAIEQGYQLVYLGKSFQIDELELKEPDLIV